MNKNHKLYTVPFSEAVPTEDGEHHFIGLFVKCLGSREAPFRAKQNLRDNMEYVYKDERSPLYNPPIPEEGKDLDELINRSQVHVATPTEIQCSNFASDYVSHTYPNGDYVYFHMFHWHDPEEFFDHREEQRLEKRRDRIMPSD